MIFKQFLDDGFANGINNELLTHKNYEGTTIDKLNKNIINHWNLYKPNQKVIIFPKSEDEFNVEIFIDSWKNKPHGDFIERYARKNHICNIKAEELFNLSINALNNTCLYIELIDIEIILVILYLHIKYKFTFNDTTVDLLNTLISNVYMDDYQVMLSYVFMKLLPLDIIYKIRNTLTNKLSTYQVIINSSYEPYSTVILTRFINMMFIRHNIVSVIIKHVFRRSLYIYLSRYNLMLSKYQLEQTVDKLNLFVKFNCNKIVNAYSVQIILNKWITELNNLNK